MSTHFRRIVVFLGLAAAVVVVACGAGGDDSGRLMASKEQRFEAAAADSAARGDSIAWKDFLARCAKAAVVRCVGFDDAGDFSNGRGGTNGAYGLNSGILPPSGTSDYTRAVRDTSVKASGNSSLRFTIPSNSPSDSSGTFFTNFSEDLSIQFGANQEFFVQWRQRFSPELLGTVYEGGGGFKQIIVGTGDQPGKNYSSCSTLELPVTNYRQAGFPVMYNSCTQSSAHGAYDGFYEPHGPNDFKLQNGRDGAGCLYHGHPNGYFPPKGNCFGYVANEWMTFQMQVKIGPRVGDVFQNSYVTLWAAREGKPSELLIKWGPYSLNAGSSTDNERYGKVWLLPYNTGKSASQAHATAYTWYDELIISRSRIADPVASPALAATPGWTTIAADGRSFSLSGTQTVRYGADTRWVEKTVTGSGQCTAAFFGSDPGQMAVKSCQVQAPAPARSPAPASAGVSR